MWQWYKNVFTLESWVKSGREYCKLTSALMVEQLRLWKICIHYGFCITYFTDFFPAMCFWLGPPMFERLIGNNMLGEFTSITREAYLVLQALAQKLPTLHSTEQINKQEIGSSDDAGESWSWNHVPPMIDLAVSWLSLKDIPYLSSLTAEPKMKMGDVQVSPPACILWVISAILHMLCSIFDRVAPDIHNELDNKKTSLPWLPHFVPKVGLKIIKNRFLDFLCSSNFEYEACPTGSGSLASWLCLFRQQENFDVSLSSVSCLQGLVQLALLIDDCIQRAKSINKTQPAASMSGLPEKILEDGIFKSAQNEFSHMLALFMGIVSSEWQVLQFEMFGRGGPAPGIGFGWASCGGGFWSLNVLLAQIDAQLILSLLNIIPVVSDNDITKVEAMKPVMSGPDCTLSLQRIHSILGVCLLAGPGDEVTLEKAWGYLFQAPVLKYLGSCVNHFLCHVKLFSTSDLQYGEEDYYYFSNILNFHYRERWLSVKRKTNCELDSNDMNKRSRALETIHEEIEPNALASRDQCGDALLVEWAHQRLPLPMHWFLSAICVMGDLRRINRCAPGDLDVAKGGLFFLLGLEAMSSFLCSTAKESLVSGIPLVWKLHALSMALSHNMDILSEERSRKVFTTLQDIYGWQINQSMYGDATNRDKKVPDTSAFSSEAQGIGSKGVLNFQTTIHESYNTFVEKVIEQFGAVSYGDIIYARQVAVYLHRTVEPTIRLAVWNALTNVFALELLPNIEECIADAEGYLEPVEDKEEILEAYAKSLVSGDLDKAATRGSLSFRLAVHHLSRFLFSSDTPEKTAMPNKLTKFILRSHLQKKDNEVMLALVQYGLTSSEGEIYKTEVSRRLVLLEGACEGNTSLLAVVEKLKSLI
ncbi:hypothetical protein Cni_G05724 [Canna indica]|uniref:RPAP1/MINIYO-like TPR repeats domain-containing protein n=1 Tax=Canna indica TaxID=4628 RepID=A0AAQ3JY83_9LILI|nr:hypothetical protein Cni_G05724 [Canna indica]